MPASSSRLLLVLLLGVLACSKTRTIARDHAGGDGGLDAATDDSPGDDPDGSDTDGTDDSAPDGDGDSQDASAIADGGDDPDYRRCHNSTYTTAPSGAPCNVKHLNWSQGLVGSCYGPVSGEAFCHVLQVQVGLNETPPPGFDSCDPPGEDGQRECKWSFGDAGSIGTLDDAALEAACAATVQFPDRYVGCIVYGS
jgi:hypothetical protein